MQKRRPTLESYAAIYAVVRAIPRGYVASYGQIALLAGLPRRARLAGRALAACQDPTVPCHRVVYGDGRLSPAFGLGGAGEQRALLEAEGVSFLAGGQVDMACCGWRPRPSLPVGPGDIL